LSGPVARTVTAESPKDGPRPEALTPTAMPGGSLLNDAPEVGKDANPGSNLLDN